MSKSLRFTSADLHARVQSGWQYVLDHQAFSLLGAARNVPMIKAALDDTTTVGLRGAARIVLAAAPAVGMELPQDWEQALSRLE
jgi:hypothetical protein